MWLVIYRNNTYVSKIFQVSSHLKDNLSLLQNKPHLNSLFYVLRHLTTHLCVHAGKQTDSKMVQHNTVTIVWWRIKMAENLPTVILPIMSWPKFEEFKNHNYEPLTLSLYPFSSKATCMPIQRIIVTYSSNGTYLHMTQETCTSIRQKDRQ